MDVLGLRELKGAAAVVEPTVGLKVRVEGCDDNVTVEGYWTPEGADAVVRLAKLLNEKSGGGCEPVMSVHRDGILVADFDLDPHLNGN